VAPCFRCDRLNASVTELLVSFPFRIFPVILFAALLPVAVRGQGRSGFPCANGRGESMRKITGDEVRKLVVEFVLTAATLLFVVLGASIMVQANAQSAEEASILKSLSPDSRAVVVRLAGLNHLPAEEWRYHAGDISHGESPDLDDSSWQVIKGRHETSDEAVWFRRLVEVPKSLDGYDLTGARIWFEFGADANGPMPEVIYFN